ncbi:hypothetical protein FQA39_LY00047 [Lamprigera yunnana]|nr:hypothetical protein FQA39_LY00047 [Lamprigera yunnana]
MVESVDKRPQFGNRFLVNEADVFQHNAWDNVQWDAEQEAEAKRIVALTSEPKLKSDEFLARENWDRFYTCHQNRFFKDRHWLFTEFPELNFTNLQEKKTVFEIGCGVGNTIIPILKYTTCDIFIYGCDFSEEALTVLRKTSDFDSERCNVFVLDASKEQWEVPFGENSIDIIVLIFVLSAIQPKHYSHIAKQMYRYLKPGGLVLFRDYGRYDLAQLRFKAGKCLEDNFYCRGDGTHVYFFTEEEVKELFEKAGFIKGELHTDRRLQVNRDRLLKMYRVWIQAKYKKPLT